MSLRTRILVPAAIVLSGAVALVYEVVWTRQLSVFLGITIRAEAVVLATFMLGLALGHRVLGKRVDANPRPLVFFAILEAAIGAYGLLSTQLLPRLAPWYARFTSPEALSTPAGDLTRFLVAAIALLIPTFLMGGTIPALVRSRILERRKRSPRSGSAEESLGFAIGRIYALNTAGAAIGAFAAGFLLLPRLGTTSSLVYAGVVNLLIALAVYLQFPGRPEEPAPSARNTSRASEPRPDSAPEPFHLETTLVAFAVFGAAALAIQLGWTQALTQILGSSVYAFSLTLSAYLAGLAIGGFLFAAWTRRRTNNAGKPSPVGLAKIAPVVGATAAVSVVLGLILFDTLPELFLQAFRWNLESRFAWLVGFSFLLVWGLVLVPTALFGFLSPLLASACSPSGRTAGRDVGTAYAINTAGTSIGALAAGFWLLPSVGLQNTLLLGAIGLMACSCLLFVARRPKLLWPKAQAAGMLLVFAIAAALTPRWDPVLTTSGVFINASRILDLGSGADFRRTLRERNRIVYYQESSIGSVSVRDVANDRLLVINGKTDGSRAGDRRTQLALGHLPMLLHGDPKEVLVVGFGTGMTPAAVSAHPEVERLDVVEISPEVIEASRYFAAENRSVLFDTRLRLHYADARNYLLASPANWDVIISEPSNPWISGVANLFTREYFELVRKRLRPNGLLAQWFQGYGMSSADLRSVIGTFTDVFEEVTIWSPQPGDLVLIGSSTPHALDAERMRRMERLPAAAEDLAATGWLSGDAFVRMMLQNSASAATFGRDAPRNTDTRPRVEFNAPRNLYRETTFQNMLDLVEHLPGEAVVPIIGRFDEASNRVAVAATSGPGDSTENGIVVRPEVRVRWTALRGANPTPLPTLAVSLRRMIAVAGIAPRDGNATPRSADTVEIDVLSEPKLPDRSRLEKRMAQLTDGTINTWAESALADGTATLRGMAGDAVTIAWTCPEEAPASSSVALYIGNVSTESADLFENALRCSR